MKLISAILRGTQNSNLQEIKQVMPIVVGPVNSTKGRIDFPFLQGEQLRVEHVSVYP